MLKVTIIGNNLDAATFINNCEIVNDINSADVVIISGSINYRSAITKFNKIANNKLIIGLGKAGSEFIAKRLGLTLHKTFVQRNFLKATIQMTSLRDLRIHEAVPEVENIILPDKHPCFILGSIPTGYFGFEYMDDHTARWLRQYECPIVSLHKAADKPYCLCVQLNPKYITRNSIKDFLNNIICEYTRLL